MVYFFEKEVWKRGLFFFIFVLFAFFLIFVSGQDLVSVYLNSTSVSNRTSDNLTAYTDQDENESLKLIYDWIVNDLPISVLNMPMDGGTLAQGGTTVRDYSIFGNNASTVPTVSSPIYFSTGGYDGKGAYYFDGSMFVVNDSNSLDITENFSISLWFKSNETINITTGNGESVVLVTKGKSQGTEGTFTWNFMIFGPEIGVANLKGCLYFAYSDGTYTPAICSTKQSWLKDEWYHVVVTWDGTNRTGLRMYVNGENQTYVFANSENANFIKTSTDKVYIGYDDLGNNNPFFGIIDEVFIFNRTLSPEQVYALYSNRTDLIVSNETSLWDVWQVCVTPNNGTSDGSRLCSNELIIVDLDVNPPYFVDIENLSFNYGDNFTYDINASDNVGVDSYFINDSLNFSIDFESGVLTNVTPLEMGVYVLNVSINDTSNNFNWTIMEINITDLAPPYFVDIENLTLSYGEPLSYDINAVDLVEFDSYFIDDNTNFSINSESGVLVNATFLDTGFYYINVSINDTFNNVNWTMMEIEVGQRPPLSLEWIFLNATNSSNYTQENLTAYTDVDNNNSLKVIYDWRIENVSLITLNMPMEGGALAEDETKILDYSQFSGNGTIFGNSQYLANGGYDGKGAYSFDGTGDYIMIEHSEVLDYNTTKNFTLELWVNYSSSNVCDGIVTKGTLGFRISCGTTNRVAFNGFQPAAGFSANTWYHLVGVSYADGTCEIYRNGVSLGSTICSEPSNSYPWQIGRFNSSSSISFDIPAVIDDVRIYNRSLSEEQITALYESRTDLIVSNETKFGEVWSVCAVSTDGIYPGYSNCSNELVINEDRFPFFENVTPENESVFENSELVDFGANVSDDFLVSIVSLNLTYPNGTSISVELENNFLDSWYNLSSGILIDRYGWYNAYLIAQDITGNENTSEIIYLFLNDTLNPEIEFLEPTAVNNSNYSRNWVALNVSVNDSFGENVLFRIYYANGTLLRENVTDYAGDFSFFNWTDLETNNVYYYYAQVNDSASNINSTNNRTITLDTLNPEIEFLEPTAVNNSNYSRNWVALNVSVNDSFGESVLFRIYYANGTLLRENITDYVGDFSFFNWTDLETDNVYYYYAQVNDSASNINSTNNRTITLDMQMPEISFVFPLNNSYLNSSSVNLSVNVSDSFVDYVLFYHNFSEWHLNLSNNSFSGQGGIFTFNLSLEDLDDGAYLWNVFANDSLGNGGFNESNFTFFIDTLVPDVEFLPDSDEDLENKSSGIIYSNVSLVDNFGGSVSFLLYDNITGEITENITLEFDNSTEFVSNTFSNLEDGVYVLYVVVNDFSGNQKSTSGRTISIVSNQNSNNGGGGGSSKISGIVLRPNSREIEQGYKRVMFEKWRVSFDYNGNTHSFFVKNLNDEKALVEVSSVLQEKSIFVGQKEKFDLDFDGYYDLEVELVFVDNSVKNFPKGTFNLKKIYEEIPVEEVVLNDSEVLVEEDVLIEERLEYSAEKIFFFALFILCLLVCAFIIAFKFNKKK